MSGSPMEFESPAGGLAMLPRWTAISLPLTPLFFAHLTPLEIARMPAQKT